MVGVFRWLFRCTFGREPNSHTPCTSYQPSPSDLPSRISPQNIFDANYSRKLSTMRYRTVVVPPGDAVLGKAAGGSCLYWTAAQEAPQDVKAGSSPPHNGSLVLPLHKSAAPAFLQVSIRSLLGDERGQQGHLRLILLPIVYNALAANDHLHDHPLYSKLLKMMPK